MMTDTETPPVEPVNAAGLADADLRHDQDEYDESEADRQLAEVDEEGE